jgi:hypothetical protein
MRKELELMETIEKYLKGNLSEQEKNAFEKRMESDPALKAEVELQKELMQGISRVAIKQSAQKGFKKYKSNRNLKNLGLTGLTVAVIALSSVFLYNSITKNKISENAPQELPELNEQGEKLWSDADRYLPVQNFELNSEKDTVIETKDGIVFAIPAHSFLDANGQPAKGNIQLEIKEALNAADIMKAGLNTRSGDKLLETGGMFYINARQDGASLNIDPKNPLYAEVPTDEVKPNMQLFEGKRLENGSIDWINPKPIQKDLIPVDILSLDFYPPHYLDSLKSWGYDVKNKKFTDSLYYSMAYLFSSEFYEKLGSAASEAVLNEMDATSLHKWKDVLGNDYNYIHHTPEGINPAEIKAIWNEKFQNTLLATKEFEERLSAMHKYCHEGSIIFRYYVDHLDKNLSAIDSMVAYLRMEGEYGMDTIAGTCRNPEFLQFAMRGDGKVKNGNKNVEMLKKYYEQKSKMYTEAIAKTVNEFWDKHNEKDIEANNKRYEQTQSDSKRTAENFKKELDLNMTEAYKQLGKEKPKLQPDGTYGVHVATTGWLNVDAYVVEATVNRTTLNYTDPESGKKAVIRYEPLTVTVNNAKDYDRILVYLLPDELNSFMRVENKDGVFRENLNELMLYKLVCIGYKGEESFYFSQDNVKPGSTVVSLKKSTNEEIRNNVSKLSSRKQSKAMHDELSYIAFEKAEAKRQVEIRKINELTNRIRPVIFPCMVAQPDTSKVEVFVPQ